MSLVKIEHKPTLAEAEASLKQQLQTLDELIGGDEMTPIDDFGLGLARQAVATSTQLLRDHAEFDTILADKDVRNIIRFIRHTREVFLEAEGERVVKKQKKIEKKKPKHSEETLNAAASRLNIGAITGSLLGKGKGLPAPTKTPASPGTTSAAPKSIEAFAKGRVTSAAKPSNPTPQKPAPDDMKAKLKGFKFNFNKK